MSKSLLTLDMLLLKFQAIHGNKYDYSLVEYKGAKHKINIICNEHGIFEQTPDNHKQGNGCPICAKIKFINNNTTRGIDKRKTFANFEQQAHIIHYNQYSYNANTYTKRTTKTEITCKIHGIFTQTPTSHLSGQGCPKCAKERVGQKNAIRGKQLFGKSVEQFIQESNIVHNNLYTYESISYSNNYTKVSITCSKHGIFYQTPDIHLHGSGCPMCSHTSKYSKKALIWIEYIMITDNIFIQHANNIGEFIIPNTRFKVDGYCKDTNTIYEYHGNKWHGNPLLFHSTDRCHPFDKNITAGELYQKTMERETKIKQLGFNLVCKWETEDLQSKSISV